MGIFKHCTILVFIIACRVFIFNRVLFYRDQCHWWMHLNEHEMGTILQPTQVNGQHQCLPWVQQESNINTTSPRTRSRSGTEPTLSKSILDECTANESLPGSVLEQCGDPSALDAQDFNLMSSIRQSQQSFIITDPSLQDNPIVYASDDFLQLTGYSRDQVLGRNCRFLQGTDTNPEKVAQIRKAVANGEDVSVTFINYMADGTAFWNKLFIAALRDAQNNIVNFIGVTVKVAGPEPGDPEAALAGQYLANGLVGTHANEDADISGDESVDADAAVMAIDCAVDKAVATAPTMTKTLS